MEVSSIIEEYNNAKDNDFRYMTLKQPVLIRSIQKDFDKLMANLYLPVLTHNVDSELQQLVSFEVLPRAVLSLFDSQVEEYNSNGLMWAYIERYVFYPIIDSLESGNETITNLLVQSLRNILNILISNDLNIKSVTRNDQILSDNYQSKYQDEEFMKLVSFMLKESQKETTVAGLQGYQETIQKLIEVSYDGRLRFLSPKALKMCIESLHAYEDYNTSSEMLLNKVIENTDIAAVAQTQQYFSLSNLKFMSKNWYKFAECCSGIIPKLIDEISKETEKSDISKMLEIISNLKDYLLQGTITNEGHPKLPSDLSILLLDRVLNILTNIIPSIESRDVINKHHNNNDLVTTESDTDIVVEDIDQQAYLDELDAGMSSNYDEDLSFTVDFEGDDTSSNLLEVTEEELQDIDVYNRDYNVIVKHSLNILYDVFLAERTGVIQFGPHLATAREKLNCIKSKVSDSNLDSKTFSLFTHFFERLEDFDRKVFETYEVLSIEELKIEISTPIPERKGAVVFTLIEYLGKDQVSLEELQSIIELIDHLIDVRVTDGDNDKYLSGNDENLIAEALLPHLRMNKSFVHTFKAGNISKKVDNGATLRTMIYTTLSRLDITKHLLVCKVIECLLHYGIKDKQDLIRDIAQSILKKLLDEHYEEILALETTWYSKYLVPIIAESTLPTNNFLTAYPPFTFHTVDS
ncbi:Hypothetical protein J6898_00078 [Nakaseomyces glabratus]